VSNISNTPEGILVRLKDKICLEAGIDVHRLKILIDKFVLNAFQGVVSSKTHFAKVNHYNELSKNKMTIKVFFKFLKIINVKRVKISITLTTLRDKEYTVTEDISLFNTGDIDD